METVNAWGCGEFVARLGCVVEHCPLAAAAVWPQRPFQDAEHLQSAFRTFLLEHLTPQAQEGVLRLHPELGAPKITAATPAEQLTTHSEGEQRSGGLLQLADPQAELLRDLNARYRETLTFPFVIFVADAGGPGAVVGELRRRLEVGGGPGGREAERQSGMEAVASICRNRLLQILAALQQP